MFERITAEQLDQQPGHIYRYELAARWLQDNDTVLDVACGVGYGADILTRDNHVNYVGVDKIDPDERYTEYGVFISGVDIENWRPDFVWDVSVCFETLEHLQNPEKLAAIISKAKKLLIVSVPTRPTKHINEFHLHDFTVEDIMRMFGRHKLLHIEDQPSELSHIFVFEGRHAT